MDMREMSCYSFGLQMINLLELKWDSELKIKTLILFC